MNVQQPSFDSGRLAAALGQLPKCRQFRLGFSGGADSTALLLAMSELRSHLGIELSALHFNHALNPDSGQWADHCAQYCDELGVPLEIRALKIEDTRGSGVEAEARRLRYQHVGGLLRTGESYLTAHHLEDQAEPLLLNLMRASGID
ncbi:MAG: tRNA lysidine(34) synthetase TilS, partial [Xanthomonadales bacterium]|nr:tRNA lysidine(34) synthetase TilS [Xanthomonadales bacterium]